MNTVVDIAIILAALVTIVAFGFLIIMVLRILELIKEVRAEIKPLIGEVQQTLSTVRGTTSFVGNELVSPMVSAASTVAGVSKAMQVLSDVQGLLRRRDGAAQAKVARDEARQALKEAERAEQERSA